MLNNPLNATDPSGYSWAKLVTIAVNYFTSASFAQSVAMSAVSYADNGSIQFSYSSADAFSYGQGSQRSIESQRFDSYDLGSDAYGPNEAKAQAHLSSGNVSSGVSGTNVGGSNMTIEGFDNDRYNKHDDLITNTADEINADKASVIGATDEQAAGIGDVDPRLVKAWMIQESGGNDSGSKSAWDADPLQANAYKRDWDKHKSGLGLKKSEAGAGDLKTNIRAGVVMIIRKGFGKSGQPPVNRPSGTFDGYKTALRRYNGRSGSTTNGIHTV